MLSVRHGSGKRPLVVAVTRPSSFKKWLTDLTLAFLSALDRERQVVFENWSSNCSFYLVLSIGGQEW